MCFLNFFSKRADPSRVVFFSNRWFPHVFFTHFAIYIDFLMCIYNIWPEWPNRGVFGIVICSISWSDAPITHEETPHPTAICSKLQYEMSRTWDPRREARGRSYHCFNKKQKTKWPTRSGFCIVIYSISHSHVVFPHVLFEVGAPKHCKIQCETLPMLDREAKSQHCPASISLRMASLSCL